LEDPKIGFSANITSIQGSDYREIFPIPDHQQFKSHHGEISNIQVPLVMGAQAFM
jgi:hypothetical protein